MTKRILAIILALTLAIGGVTVAGASTVQINRLFTANVFVAADNNWIALDRADAIDTAEARSLQLLFERFFRNDLAGLHITQNTGQIALRPAEGIELSAVIYNAQSNTFRTLELIRVCANGFSIFEIPQGAEFPISVVVSNGILVPGARPQPAPLTTAATNRDRDRDNGGSNGGSNDGSNDGGTWTPPTPPPPPPTPPPAFVAVTGITGVPTAAISGLPLTLTGTINPTNATNSAITWSVENAGTTGANITGGNVLNTTAAGTVTVRATITNGATASTNFTQDFDITVTTTSFTVTFLSNFDGGPLPFSITVESGQPTLAPAPNRPGYFFVGWFDISASSGGTQFQTGPVGTPVTADKTVWARWAPA